MLVKQWQYNFVHFKRVTLPKHQLTTLRVVYHGSECNFGHEYDKGRQYWWRLQTPYIIHSNDKAPSPRRVHVNIFLLHHVHVAPSLSDPTVIRRRGGRKTMRGRAIYRESGVIAPDVGDLRHIVRFCRTHVYDSTQILVLLLLGLFKDFLSLLDSFREMNQGCWNEPKHNIDY